jgi:hypothetical protein
MGRKRVVPGMPEMSVIVQKVDSTLAAMRCGGAMPQGRDPLTATEIKLLRDWIAAGAKM